MCIRDRYKTAHEQVMNSLEYAYRDRRNLKREMRKLWIARINAAARMNDISYSKLMHGLKLANVEINRKMLSEIAIADPQGFTAVSYTHLVTGWKLKNKEEFQSHHLYYNLIMMVFVLISWIHQGIRTSQKIRIVH